MVGHVHGTRRPLAMCALVGAAVLALAACGGGGQGASATASAASLKDFSVLLPTENTTISDVLTKLSTDQCSAENDALKLKIETVPQTSLDQKVQLLAGQDSLPALFAVGNVSVLKQLLDNGQALDLEKAYTASGAIDNIQPAAISTIKAIDGAFSSLPFEYNIEGFWYNKQLFADNGIEPATTWADMVTAAQTLSDNGVQPFSASGEQGWPISRLVGNYIYREVGPDAFQKVADGQASLTDPEYVKGAQAVADLGAKGWFGPGVGSIDYDTAMNTFLTGKAAMFYMGSWALANFADPKANQIGVDNIGFFSFPEVTGGAGSADQLPANAGISVSASSSASDPKAQAWLDCIAKNYGAVALKDHGQVTGFTVNEDVPVNDLTKLVQDKIAATKDTVLWFEALVNAKAQTASTTNAPLLVNGGVSAEDFMSQVQAANK